jgi:sulfur relay (sulfurtransferase) complex TusBCD TusD component (DsrE family)
VALNVAGAIDDGSALLFGVMGAPYESELSTSLLRMVSEALDGGYRITVWTCGGATTLTRAALGDVKPKNLLDLLTGSALLYPSTAALIGGMVRASAGRLQWLVCRHCAEERGALDQIAEARIQPPLRFAEHLERCDVPVIMGVK